MNEPQSPSIEGPLKRLTVAVWLLFALGLVTLSISFYFRIAPRPSQMSYVVGNSTPPRWFAESRKYADFSDWPVKRQIAAASVIALAKYQRHGNTVTPVITEIMKKTPGTVFNYKRGDKLARQSFQIEKGVAYHGGLVLFFTGSPATFQYAASYGQSRLFSYGDMPFKMFRRMIREQEASMVRGPSHAVQRQ
jgi:hypothetical protein